MNVIGTGTETAIATETLGIEGRHHLDVPQYATPETSPSEIWISIVHGGTPVMDLLQQVQTILTPR